MIRSLIVVLAIALTPTVGLAADACGGLTVRDTLSGVSFFASRMLPVSTPDEPVLRLVHQDDPGLTGAFELVTAPAAEPVRRSQFLEQLDKNLDAEVAKLAAAGHQAEKAVIPYDPITWSVVTRDDDIATGATIVRLSPTCSLQVNWVLPETPTMAGRTAEFRAAIDAVRQQHTGAQSNDFVEERLLPKAWQALLVGVVAPIVVSLALGYILKHMVFLSAPGLFVRGIAVAIAVAASVAVWSQGAIYLESLASLAFMDNAILMTMVFVAGVAAAVSGLPKMVLVALCLACVSGMSLAVSSGLNWAPDAASSLTAGAVFSALGLIGLLQWQIGATAAIRARTQKSA